MIEGNQSYSDIYWPDILHAIHLFLLHKLEE